MKPHPLPALACTSDGTGIRVEVEGKEQAFQFDRVFGPDSTQQAVFNEVSELIQSALDGFQVGPQSRVFVDGDLNFSLGEATQRYGTLARILPLPISLSWLECSHREMWVLCSRNLSL